MFILFCLAGIRGAVWAVQKYNKIAAPIRAWIKKVDTGLEELSFNGGSKMKDVLFKTAFTVERIAEDMTAVKNRQTAMLELNDAAMFECDKEGYCTSANSALCSLFEATPNQMAGHGWLQFIKDPDKEAAAWNSAIRSDNEITREYIVKVGKNRQDEMKCKYIAHIKRNDEGEVINVTGKVTKI
jgi:PAS domain S-box-containing protein